ncbi:MAG: MarR family transcriptional regulator [bacterium]|nr:MarR family transcriptional regulator [bacterium]
MKTKESNEAKFSSLMSGLIRKLNLLNKDQKVCYGLTLPQCGAIEALDRKGLLPMNELSQQMGVTISTMTRIVNILVRDGYIAREENPEDRRKVCIQLTESGRSMADKLKKCSTDYSRAILNTIPGEKREQVFESLELLIGAIESINTKCCG